MGGTKVENTVFGAGQNQGIDAAVLPMPQLASAINVRMRKGGRWGKRWGYSLIDTSSLVTNGYARCFGPGFGIVNATCQRYDQTAASFVSPSLTAPANSRVSGAVSGWLPDRAFFPAPALSARDQTTTPCASAYALGYLWTVTQFRDPTATTDQMLRIVATDPNDQSLVYLRDLRPTVGGGGGIRYPRLVLIGSTLALTYVDVASATLRGRVLTSLAGNFGAEITITGAGIIAYDVSAYTGTACLFAITYGGNAITVGTLNAALVQASVSTYAEVNPVTSISIVGSISTPVYIGYGITASALARVRVYATGFAGAVVGTVTLTAPAGSLPYTRPLLALLQAGGVRVVFAACEVNATGNLQIGSFSVCDVSALAVAGTVISQYGVAPIGLPFSVGSAVYMWCQLLLREPITGFGGYPVLLAINASGSAITNSPIEMSAQDFITGTGSGVRVCDLLGLPSTVQIGSSADYAALMPVCYGAAGLSSLSYDFRVLQATHYSDSAARRGLRSFPADSAHFVPMGALTRVDARGAVEEGFVHGPAIAAPVPSVGGSMTSSVDYQYTAVFVSRNDSGRLERSKPALPVAVTMGVGDGTATLSITPLYLSARQNVLVEIYRTLGDGQTFYLLTSLTASNAVTQITYVDTSADTVIEDQPALYTQVGQQLANGFPPASRFGCSGGSRAFVGGCLRPDIVVGSKLILGDQSPTFCDSDAFKVIAPAPVTGVAWMDALVVFTAEGIYVASGDGPTDDGVGDFGTVARLPFELGCIEPRSVITVGDGTFFQSNRGLYLLPRGFGDPIPAGDVIMDTLAAYPVINGAVTLTKPTEQTVRWNCSDAACVNGAQIVYDLAHKAWGVDSLGSATSCIGQWLSNEVVSAEPQLNQLRATNSGFADNGLPISMSLTTGDQHPFGVLSEGAITRVQVLAELRSACALQVDKTTEWGSSTATRVFALAPTDYQVGQLSVTCVELGPAEARDAFKVQVRLSESSATEGIAFIAMALEHEQGEGLKLASPLSRIT